MDGSVGEISGVVGAVGDGGDVCFVSGGGFVVGHDVWIELNGAGLEVSTWKRRKSGQYIASLYLSTPSFPRKREPHPTAFCILQLTQKTMPWPSVASRAHSTSHGTALLITLAHASPPLRDMQRDEALEAHNQQHTFAVQPIRPHECDHTAMLTAYIGSRASCLQF